MRIFVAIALDTDLRELLQQRCRQLAQTADAARWRWSMAANYHLTLVFLGQLAASELAAVARASRAAAEACAQFQCHISDIVCFPDPNSQRPKCLVAEVAPCKALSNLHQQLATRLQQEGISFKAQHYRPHITVARGIPQQPGVLSQCGKLPSINRTLSVDAVTIYQSSLQSSAVIYAPLASFALSAA